MARKRKQRKCRRCKKRPVWRGGDVKNPGPYCKKCYHQRIWVRPGSLKAVEADDEPLVPFDPDEYYLTQIKPFE